MESDLTYTPDLARLKRMFEQARDSNDEYRSEAFIDDDYFHGYQLTPEERAVLNQRKQPTIYFNEVRLAVRGLVGVFEQGESDPKAYPRNPQDDETADVATKALRYAKDVADWSSLRTACALNYFVQGTCATIVQADAKGRPDVVQVRFEEFVHDPRSRALDFSDARYMGVAKWMFADDVAAMYPDNRDAIMSALDGGTQLATGGDTFSDRPDGEVGIWADRKLRRIFTVELYHREGEQWMRCVFWGGGILEAGVSPYLDGDGKPRCPIYARSCYIDRENRRYGEVRDLRPVQDGINKRESKLLHLLNNRQVRAVDPAYADATDANTVRSEAARPDGVLPPGWDVVSLNDMAAGQFQLLASAREFMQRIGQNPSVLAQQSASASGRAQLARQQAGMVDSAMSLNGLRRFELAVYRGMWDICKQFWTAPDWIRVTDDENAPQFVGINQPQYGPPQVMQGPDGMAMIGRPLLGYENAMAEMVVDITIDAVPDVANLAQEQFQALTELARLYGPQEVPFDDMLAISSIPDKAKLITRRKERQDENNQAGGQQQELQMRGAIAEISRTEADAALLAARAANEQAKPAMEAFKLGASVAGAQ